jgi:hypothetical protein
MKNFRLLVFTFLVALFATTNSFAQEKGTFSYHFGAAIPSGNFADDSGSRPGNAGFGLNLGFQYVYPLSADGLGLFAGVDINYNGLKKSFRNDIEDELATDVDVTFLKYLNLPVSGGLHYTFKVNDKVSLYGKGGLVASFLKLTNMKISSGNEEAVMKYDLSTALGYTIGGGFILNDKIELGLTYFGLGEHEITGETDYGHGNTEKLDKQKIDDGLLNLTIGFKF